METLVCHAGPAPRFVFLPEAPEQPCGLREEEEKVDGDEVKSSCQGESVCH